MKLLIRTVTSETGLAGELVAYCEDHIDFGIKEDVDRWADAGNDPADFHNKLFVLQVPITDKQAKALMQSDVDLDDTGVIAHRGRRRFRFLLENLTPMEKVRLCQKTARPSDITKLRNNFRDVKKDLAATLETVLEYDVDPDSPWRT